MRQAVLLLSSGLDSAANLVLTSTGQSHAEDIHGHGDFKVAVALTVNYGQKGAKRELIQAAVLARHFGVEHVVFDLSHFADLVGSASALFGKQGVPQLRQDTLDDLSVTTQSASAVWVPNRNAVLLSLAAAFAEARGLDSVAVGFNAEEAVTFADNTPDFMDALSRAFVYSTSNKVKVVSHTVGLDKQQIVQMIDACDFPFELLWSCYEDGEVHCGRCESCQRLKRSVQAGIRNVERKDLILKALFGRNSEVF